MQTTQEVRLGIQESRPPTRVKTGVMSTGSGEFQSRLRKVFQERQRSQPTGEKQAPPADPGRDDEVLAGEAGAPASPTQVNGEPQMPAEKDTGASADSQTEPNPVQLLASNPPGELEGNRINPGLVQEGTVVAGPPGDNDPSDAMIIGRTPQGAQADTDPAKLIKPPVVQPERGQNQPLEGAQLTGSAAKDLAPKAGAPPLIQPPPENSDRSKGSGKKELPMVVDGKPAGEEAKTAAPGLDLKKLMTLESQRWQGHKDNPGEAARANIPADEAAQNNAFSSGLRAVTDLSRPGLESLLPQGTDRSLPVNHREVLEQIVQKAELLLRNNASEMKIDLKPEFLGKMTISIAVEEGVLTARFMAENQQVRQMLEANMNSLRQTLEAQGVRVEKTEVNVYLDNSGNGDNRQDGHQQWQQPSLHDPRLLTGPEELFKPDAFPGEFEEGLPPANDFYEGSTMDFLV